MNMDNENEFLAESQADRDAEERMIEEQERIDLEKFKEAEQE